MLKATSALLRNRTAWRELLHPLPIAARHDQWLKRDTVEINEAVLRKPYYSIKSHHTLLPQAAASSSSSSPTSSLGANDASFDAIFHGRGAGRPPLPERLAELRAQMNLSAGGTSGPAPHTPSVTAPSYQEEYGARLRPRYPSSWDTVAPHQPSRV